MMPQIVITQRGPNLSLRPAEKTHRRPNIIVFNAEAPEVIALVQPNSFMKGSKNTPKALKVPHIIIIMMEAALTMT
jgi:hypothetical protein